MRLIQIRYPRFLLGEKHLKVNVPTSWNELTADQLTAVAGLLYSKEVDIYQFKIQATKELLKLKWHQIIILRERLIDLFPFIRFLEEENTLTMNKYIFFKLGFKKYYGPIGNFETLRADEWTEADQAFLDYHASKDEADLDRMIAVLFRPKADDISPDSNDWKNDWRKPFNEHSVYDRSLKIVKLDRRIKFGILTWYQGCRLEWESLFERVFKGSEQMVESFGWMETIQKLSGGTFGSLEETEKTPMYKLMLNMEITIKDDEFRKDQEKHQKAVGRHK